MFIRGSVNQAADIFENRGQQCICNSVAALVHSEKNCVTLWSSKDLDQILSEGDLLHSKLFKYSQTKYPVITDLPTHFEVSDFEVKTSITDSYTGLLSMVNDSPPYFTFDSAISKVKRFGVVIIGPATPAFSSAIITDGNTYNIFDPHSRDCNGMACSDGKAVLTTFTSTEALKDYFERLSSSLGLESCPFEVTPIDINVCQVDGLALNFNSLQPEAHVAPDNSDSADSDVPLASIKRTLQTKYANDSDSDDAPLINIQRKTSLRKRTTQRGDVIFNNSDEELQLDFILLGSDSDNDPNYIPSEDEYSDGGDCEKSPRTTLQPSSTSPLKYMQVSVDAIRVIAGDSDANESAGVSVSQTSNIFLDNCLAEHEMVPFGNDQNNLSGLESADITNSSLQEETSDTPNVSMAITDEIEMQPDSIVPSYSESGMQVRGRKRRRNEENWKDSKRKRAVNLGEAYVNRKGKQVPRKTIKPGCGARCRLKCHERMENQQRENTFHFFWRTGSLDKRRIYVCQNVDKKNKKTGSDSSRRSKSLVYNLTIDGSKTPVCKNFFLDTLGISERFVSTAFSKLDDGGHIIQDMRGRHSKMTESRSGEKEQVRRHIQSFPTVESHYCRKDSQRRYLGASLNLATMYRLYKEQRNREGAIPVSSTVYCEIFRTEFNLGFHNPSKDRCDFCVSFENMSSEEKEEEQHRFDDHQRNKIKLREKMTKDKEDSIKDPSKLSVCFDLQEVLMTPHSTASVLYYKRKLNTYNLSLYDLGSRQAVCNVWHEGVAARGSNEIGSCVFEYLKGASERGVEHVTLYSDSCGGQNRNKYFLTMLWYSLNKFDFTEIEHNFFVKGHSKNENDSVHATIERVSKNVDVYTTPQWAGVMSTAKQSKPKYIVNELDESRFFDFKEIARHLKNFDLDNCRQKVRWLNIRSMKLTKQEPNTVHILYDCDGEYHRLNLLQRIRKAPTTVSFQNIKLPILNNGKGPGIDKDKYDDLQFLCRTGIIPRIHHQFFNLLKLKTK